MKAVVARLRELFWRPPPAPIDRWIGLRVAIAMRGPDALIERSFVVMTAET